jgi:hypothetical protein
MKCLQSEASLRESEGSISDLNAPECASSGNPKSIHTQAPFCASTGPTCPTTATSEESQLPLWSDPTCSAEGFRASRLAAPGNAEAQRMTVTSGRKWLASLKSSSPLGSLVRTLLTSTEWRSSMCYLIWKGSATKSRRAKFRLVPLGTITGGRVSGFFGHANGYCESSGAEHAETSRLSRVQADAERGRTTLGRNASGARRQRESVSRHAAGIAEDHAARMGSDDGLSNRMDRLRCLGNSVVPQIAEIIGRAIIAAGPCSNIAGAKCVSSTG